jgi:uncharacterized protein YigE (DUF2233 family)
MATWFIERQDHIGINSMLWRVGRRDPQFPELTLWLHNKSGVAVRTFRTMEAAQKAAERLERMEG